MSGVTWRQIDVTKTRTQLASEDRVISRTANRQSPIGFSLVELLVVITIIVILLALLAPALDKAIYQTQLAVCGARLKALGGSAMTYAFDSRRAYPHRRIVQQGGGYWTNQLTNNNFDDRLVLRSHFVLNAMLNDPFTRAVDYENFAKDPGGRPTWAFSAYDLWFGWRWVGMKAMARIGDRFTWVVPSAMGTAEYSFDLLATDMDWQTPDALNFIAGHPDAEPHAMHQRRMDNQSYDPTSESASFATSAGTLLAWAWWDVRGVRRGPVDRNFAHQDGSVGRMITVTPDDPRCIRASYTANGGAGAPWKTQVPEEH